MWWEAHLMQMKRIEIIKFKDNRSLNKLKD
jgi:hypothetical protein